MNRFCVSTRGIGSWRERLANPDRQWKRGCSAFETAVSWELASRTATGIPEPVAQLFRESNYHDATLMLAVAEHQVDLPGGRAPSQCDVWSIVNTSLGAVSLSVEAKAKEPFGKSNESLSQWLVGGKSPKSREKRQKRWSYIREHLPMAGLTAFDGVAYQLLHRCAAAVIEAKRCRVPHAAFVVQAFNSPAESFAVFSKFCGAFGITPERGRFHMTTVGEIQLAIGWADCVPANERQIAKTA